MKKYLLITILLLFNKYLLSQDELSSRYICQGSLYTISKHMADSLESLFKESKSAFVFLDTLINTGNLICEANDTLIILSFDYNQGDFIDSSCLIIVSIDTSRNTFSSNYSKLDDFGNQVIFPGYYKVNVSLNTESKIMLFEAYLETPEKGKKIMSRVIMRI